MMVLRMSVRILSTALIIATSSSRPFVAAFSSLASSVRTTALSGSLNRLAMASQQGSSQSQSPSVPTPSSDTDIASAAVASAARALNLFIETPLIFSSSLTALTGPDRPVYLKLDVLQRSGSFKDRGVAHLCHTLQQTGVVSKLVSSSGGNAGLAVATVAAAAAAAATNTNTNTMQVQVIVPTTTKQLVVDKLQRLGADVTVFGENWNAADVLARQRVADDLEGASAYISPYDNPLLWTGHSTVIDEIEEQLQDLSPSSSPSSSLSPAAVILSVGGGGLMCGVLEGLERRGLTECAVIGAETIGASSFGQAFRAGEVVRLARIDSIATSLGALQITPAALERASKHQTAGGVVLSALCTDAEAVNACWQFAQDHRILVEPACGAALAVVYSERLRALVLPDIVKKGPIVIEVCGGSGVNVELLTQWKKDFLE
jgi:L-serine/L-threonine ammonia-lyase